VEAAKDNFQMKRISYVPYIASALAAAAGLYAISLYEYLFFHSLAEVFSILIACGIFLFAWNCRRYFDHQYFLFIGIGYLFVGLLDLIHTFAYKGMHLMPGYGANTPTQLWIALRYLQGLTLLAAPLMIRQRIRPALALAGYGLAALLLLLSILYWQIFPDCFRENAGGLTPFKIISEYVIALIFIAAGGLIVRLRSHFDADVFKWLLLSIGFSVASGLSFTAYATSIYGFFNMLGHYFEIVSFFCMYKAVIETGLTKPYNLLFRDLEQHREWLDVTLGSIGDAVIACDLTGRITFLNPVAADLTGWGAQEALGRPALEVLRTINEISRAPAKDIAACVLEQKCTLNMANHTALISRDGTEIPIEDSAAPIKDRNGKVIGVVIVFRDVTAKRKARGRLEESERTYRAIAHNFPDGAVYLFDRDLRIHVADGLGLPAIGLSREALEGKTVSDHPLHEIIAPRLRRIFDGERFSKIELEYQSRIRHAYFVPVRNEQGETIFALLVARDVTDQRANETRLRRSELLYRELVQNANSAIIRWKSDGTIVFFNEYAQEFFGYRADEVIGKPVNILIPETESPGSDINGLTNDILDHPERYIHHINENICRNNRRVWMNWTNKPIYDANGKVAEILAVGSDITALKTTEEALVKSEQKYRDLAHELEIERSKLATAIASMPVGFEIGDMHGTTLLMNQAWLKLHGFESEAEMRSSPEEYRKIFELRYPDGKVLPPKEWPAARALRGEFVQDFELVLRNRLKDRERICSYSSAPVPSANGDAQLVVYTMQDITESKKAQKALQRSIERFELLSNIAGRLLAAEDPQAMVQELCCEVMAFLDCQAFFNFLVDEQAGKLRLNAYNGISSHEAHNIEWIDFGAAVCGCVAEGRHRIVAEDILNSPDIRTKLVQSFGIQAHCCHPLIIGDHLIGTLSFGTRRRPHFAPEEVDLMRTVADNVALAMQRIQIQKTLQDVNKELEQKVVQRTEELVKNYERLSQANVQLQVRADQLRRLTSELTMAEQRERKRLSKILHDGLQQHLATAKLRIGYFADKLQAQDRKQEAYDIEAILSETMQMSRSLSVELSPPVLYEAGLAKALEWLTRWMRDRHDFNVELATACNPRLPEDVTILVFESVRELLFNAVKHAKVSWARVALLPGENSEIRIVVSDEGEGFDPSLLDTVASDSGGLGLFSIRERIDSIGGRFDIASAPGKGCRFTLTVSTTRKSAAALTATTPAGAGAIGRDSCKRERIRVLIADDHALFRDGIGRILNYEPDLEVVGYATDGAEAIELARKLMPDIILMDIGMPGVDGIEATRAICGESAAIRVIGLSMYEDEERSRSMLNAGAIAYKNKGCAPAELVAAIRNGICQEQTVKEKGTQSIESRQGQSGIEFSTRFVDKRSVIKVKSCISTFYGRLFRICLSVILRWIRLKMLAACGGKPWRKKRLQLPTTINCFGTVSSP